MSSSKQRLSMCSKTWEELKGEEIQPWLPDDIMYLIIGKLMAFPAYLARFSAVCKWWHRLVFVALPKLVREQQINPLVLDPVMNSKEDGVMEVSCRIYNLMGQSALAPVISLPRGRNQIIGSSFGWLIVTNRYHLISLFNPVSKHHIRLPPLDLHHISSTLRSWSVSPSLIPLMKGVLSKPPRFEGDGDGHFDIAITMDPRMVNNFQPATAIAFLHVEKIGELESLRWVYHDFIIGDQILDVNSIGGRICILYTSGIIGCCRCSTDRFSCYYAVRKAAWSSSSVLEVNHYFGSAYLLESSSLEPLVVLRYKECNSFNKYRKPTVRFKILTLTSISGNCGGINEFNKTWNWTEENANTLEMMEMSQQQQHLSLLNWTETKTLGNDVIFLDDIGAICIQAGSKLQQSAGSIYFPDKYDPIYTDVDDSAEAEAEGTDFGVFNIDQNSITHFFHRPEDTETRLAQFSLQLRTDKILQSPPMWLQVPSYDEILKFSSIG